MDNNQIPNLNQNNDNSTENNTNIEPIKEVKVEQISNKEVPKNKNVSGILLIILFIFLFAFVMGMPYIKNFVQQFKSNTGLSEIEKEAKEEEERQKQQEESKKSTSTSEEDKTTELVCTSANQAFDNYSLVEIQKFNYNSKKQILNSSIVSQYSFTTPNETYTTLKAQCEENSLKYITNEGYTMACSYSDTSIEITHEFDLETYVTINDGDTTINANATYKQNIDEIKANLLSQGYTCE